MNKAALAARRLELLERCEEQRIGLVMELHALGSRRSQAHPLAGAVLANLLAHKRLVLGVVGSVAGLLLARPARAMRIVRFATSTWRMARNGMALVARFRH